ncbi:MAG: hypothetical protein ACK54F_03370 [Planctomycetia bacterium]|jgi:hypothetical protein
MITYPELKTVMQANLDAEGSDRYLDVQDYVPAINSAVSRAMTAIGWSLAQRDGSEEALRDMTYVRMFQTNSQGGVAISDPALVASLGHGVWNVLAVYAEPETVEQNPAILPLPVDSSVYRDDVSWSGSGQPVERVTLEEVPVIRNNRFLSGNETLAANPKRRMYAYYIVGNASSSAYGSGMGELRVLPQSQTGQKLIAIAYLANPVELDANNYLTVQIPFPQSVKRTLADWALQYIAWKQGDGTNLQMNAQKDAAELFQLTTN